MSFIILSVSVSKAQIGAGPAITFISIIIFAIVIAEFLIDDQRNQRLTILFGVIFALIAAGIELRNLIKHRPILNLPKETKEVREKQLAKYVAELFDEDIEFEEDTQGELDKISKSDLD